MCTRNQMLALLGLLLISVQIPAKDRPFIDEPGDNTRHDLEENQWKEGQIHLPGQYQEKNLQEFQMDVSDENFRYFIDRSSLQTTTDKVSRFILVIRSRNGVDNSSYEGMRCGKREYKVYAYGSKQGFTRLPETGWQHIRQSGYENYRYILYSDLICNTQEGKANQPDVVFRAMQHNIKVNNSVLNQD